MKKNSKNLADLLPCSASRPMPWRASAALLALMAVCTQLQASGTVIAPEPLATASSVQAKPNVMFILDGSGSMESSFMPDDAEAKQTETYAYRSSQCNGLAYDPNYDYTANRPLQADTTADAKKQYPSQTSISSVDVDGFNTSASAATGTSTTSLNGGTTGTRTFVPRDLSSNDFAGLPVRLQSRSDANLWMVGIITAAYQVSRTTNIDFTITSSSGSTKSANDWNVTLLRKADLSGQYYYAYDSTKSGSVGKMGWTYSTTSVDDSTDFYKQCTSVIGGTAGKNFFSSVKVSSLTATQKENYANWYAYFRTRVQLMRTAAGRAFADLDAKYRVGFTTIDSTGVTNDANFQGIEDFGATQKQTFLTKLYARVPANTTPLRASLSKVGRYYANKIPGQTDPVQYSCQRNYAILSTDGYWNTNNETDTYQPFQVDGSTLVGQQDGDVSKPQYDGQISTSTVTKTWQRYSWVVNSRTNRNSCSNSQYSTQITVQTRTETIVTSNGAISGDTFTNWKDGSAASYCFTAAELTARGISSGTSGYSTSTDKYLATTDGSMTAQTNPVAKTTGGSSDSLADVAQYYYVNDLRKDALSNCSGLAVDQVQNDACTNNVPTSDLDTANWQHMTTSTIGLGVSGTLTYDPAYLTQQSGDYVKLTQGTKNWPVPGNGKEAVNIDDLWHAAVNGRGRYFSALNASDLVNAIALSLGSAGAADGAASAAATNSLKPVSGDNNQVYVASYRTVDWTGDVKAHPLDATTGAVDTNTVPWSAQVKLDGQSAASRTIYYRRPNGSLQSFTYDNLNTDGFSADFAGVCAKSANRPAQCDALSPANKDLANAGANLVNFLRGDKTFETTNSASPLYRSRAHRLGDIVGGAPAYVGKPPFIYTDAGYTDYKTSQDSRSKVLFAAANDGMLHAFAAEDLKASGGNAAAEAGSELWAFVPTKVIPKLFQLADAAYGTNHQYYVDGAPVVGDIKVGSNWKTILVGGLGAGGKGYYALDITDPRAPVALWEFTDANLGLSVGNPIITKRADGTWVVVIASGYNNHEGGGDGRGHLFVLNAANGQPLLDLSTSAGSTGTPSGLAKINAWVDDPTNNTATRFYGGDLMGNLWRFDTDNLVGASGTEAMLMAQFMLNSDPTKPQPITTAPQPVSVKSGNTSYPVVIVGTGSYLGSPDVGSTTQQSIYALKDSLTSTGLGDVRASAALVNRSIVFTEDGNSGNIASGTVDWATKIGWQLDLPKSGERLVTDMAVQFNMLAAVSAIPGSSVCTPSGGSSWLYLLDVSSGTAPDSVTSASSYLGAFLGVGITWVQTTNGDGKLEIVGSDRSITTKGAGNSSPTPGSMRRTSWRELVD